MAKAKKDKKDKKTFPTWFRMFTGKRTKKHKNSYPTCLKIINYSKRFGDEILFTNMSYTFTPGVYSFEGQSGVGKTTLMRCIAGLDKDYQGTIALSGKILSGTNVDVHMVHQHYWSYPWLNCLDNVLMTYKGHRIRITKEVRQLAISFLTEFGLGNEVYKKPGKISGGQDQRLSMVGALINPESRVFLFDEPSSALDEDNTKLCARLIRELQIRNNAVVIVITHDALLKKELNPIRIVFDDKFRFRDLKGEQK